MSPKTFSAYWFDIHIPKFTQLLSCFKNIPNVHFLEIGSFEGRSSCWFLDEILTGAGSTLTCVDTWQGSMENTLKQKQSIWNTFQNNIQEYGERCKIYKDTSRNILRNLQCASYDFIYIDGSHTTKDVLTDAVLSFELLKVGGVLTFDDYTWKVFENPSHCPETGINAFLACYKDFYNLIEVGLQVTIQKTTH